MKKCTLFFFLLLLPFLLKAQTGIITTICGNGTNTDAGDGGLAISAKISDEAWGVFDRFGNYYFTEANHRVRKISTSGIISTVAGTGTAGYNGDLRSAITAQLNNPKNIALDSLGNLYIADAVNYRVRKVDVVTGFISTVAGNGINTYSGDGLPATNASIDYAIGLCIDPFGNMYIYSGGSSVIRKVNTAGTISTFAGTPGSGGLTGDGGPATAAELTSVEGLCSDKYGNIFLAGFNVREVNVSTGAISLIAGNGTPGYGGDGGPATTASLYEAIAVNFSNHGLLFISDKENNRIRKIDSLGIITTVVGNGTQGFFGNTGKDTAAELNRPQGVAFDSCDNMYINDLQNYRIRKVTYPIIPSTISVSAPSVAGIGSSVTATASVTNVGTKYSIEWMNYGTVFATTAVPSVTYTKTMVVDNITAKIIPNACYDTAMSASVIVSSPAEGTGIPPGMGAVSIFPNPANDVLHINNLQNEASYRMLTVVGSVIQQGELAHGNNRISITALPKGMYMLEINSGPTVIVSSPNLGRAEVKIVKQ